MNSAVCLQHGSDESAYAPVPPDAVLYPETTEEVAQVAAACNEWRVPIIAFGVGSSVEGHLLAIHGGISIDMSGMNQVLSVRPQDLTATVQAGVTR